MSFPVWESQNSTRFDCARDCRSKLTCLSYSYSTYLEECLMFQHDSETAPEYLKSQNGYVFYDMVNRDVKRQDYTGICKNNHKCLNGGSCRNDCSQQGFYCVCADGFRGEFCEKTFENDLLLVDSLLVPASRGTTIFTFNNALYLFVGGFYDSDPGTVEAPTSVFKNNNVTNRFELFQELTNTGVTLKLTNFVLMGRQYVFVSTYQAFGGSRVTQSHLFVYENETDSFEVHQTFTTYGVWGAYTLRTTGGDFFMFLANHNGNSYNENSEIYRWHPRYEKFFKVQDIATYGVCSSQIFELDGEVYLALPFYYSATSGYSVSSQLWKQSSTYDNYIGCYEDQSTRALSGDTYSDSSGMTIQTCIDFCRELDYPYAGLQAGSSCFCGDDNYDVYNVKSDGECSTRCSGNNGLYCGGSWRNSVYSVSSSWSSVQDLPDTNVAGTTGALYFNHSGVDYLVMVHHQDGSSCTQDTIIFALNSEDGQFEEHQKLSVMYCAIDAQIFKVRIFVLD
ncbi:WSC domain-containing protein 2 [Holothuria leucospilota]|uniref:WSC domain-containing protein 2 n=1 Tax=Holothuria leucospilota TaxID=206669 RepID=A0A9Q0YKB6_HOLLE|nr:WSC domain-containing protein 2 [Holothuria leucospilota]